MKLKFVDKVIKETISLQECLAKTDSIGEKTMAGMTIEEHSVLTAEIAMKLEESMPVQKEYGLFPQNYISLVCLHDIGKVSLPFQAKIWKALGFPENTPEVVVNHKDFAEVNQYDSLHHTTIGRNALKFFSEDDAAAYVVGSHHGGLRSVDSSPIDAEKYGGEGFAKAKEELYQEFTTRYGKLPSFENDAQKRFISGLTIVSDWISSTQTKRSLVEHGIQAIVKKAVCNSKICPILIKKGLSFESIFGFPPRQVQKNFYENVKGPGVYVLETGMGMGKTEAALYSAYRMMEEGKASGIYFALPTKLTSLKIYDRVKQFAEEVVQEDCKANVMLAFGGSLLSEQMMESEDSWFNNRKRMLLAPIGVGTVDQALMSVIAVKHSDLRCFGLAGKVVILDEIHSYDVYTGRLVNDMVRLLVQLGCTVIILSATLRSSLRSELLLCHKSQIHSNAYPLISTSYNGVISEFPEKQEKKVSVQIVHSTEEDNASAYDMALDVAERGGYVLWIENSVEEAQNAFLRLNQWSSDNVEVGLIHSRFIQSQRNLKEEKWTGIYGKDSIKLSQRSHEKGYILVGTQVLEQSLDIDADLLVTMISPIDMLLQRIGRLWRHEVKNRVCEKPTCCFMHPKREDAFLKEGAFGPTGYIYEPYILCRTFAALENKDCIRLPEDIRPLIDEVYAEHNNLTPIELKYREKMQTHNAMLAKRSRLARCTADGLLPDIETSTRYSEQESVDVLMVRDMDMEAKKIVLLDGNVYNLVPMDRKERARISKALQDSVVSVPKNRMLPQFIPSSWDSILSPFLYLGQGDSRLRLGVVRGKKYLDGMGNAVSYDDIIGYRATKGKGEN